MQVEHLEIALKTARVIGMTMGVLMARRGLTEGTAFELLAETSQRLNRKLRLVADEVVLSGDLPR
ncbi:ANTAR domain-containing protein [Modestobacter sp. NPDC049651]|uniref:ANTAR domain-containing protein n=1 Tax=unclassified Modestobacter TaxID=2643866 RepID=UPI0034083FE4